MVENNFDKVQGFVNNGDCQENFQKGKEWSFDLKVGDEYFVSGDTLPSKLTDSNPFIIIKPGQFAILETKETVSLNREYMALISVKFSFKKKGLINVSGFHVDPLYKGKIIFTVFNAGPNEIYIKRDEYVFMIFFMKLTKPLPKECDIRQGYQGIPKEMFANLGGGSLTLMEYNKKIEQIEFYIKFIIVPVAISIFVFLIGSFFKSIIH